MIIPWILMVAAAVITLQALLYRKKALHKLEYNRYFSESKVACGDTIELIETIQNRKWLPLPWVRIESLLSAGLTFHKQHNLKVSRGSIYQNHRSLFQLTWHMRITRRHKLTCSKRGYYKLDTATLTSGDIFAVVQQNRSIPLDSTLIVLPKLIPIDNIRLPSHSWQGDIIVRRWIIRDPFMISGVRPYQQGDPMKWIHWKATARSGAMQVYQQDFTADRRLYIVLNIEESETMWKKVTNPERIEHGISVAATLAKYAIDHGLEVGFASNGMTVEQKGEPVWISPAAGSSHVDYIMEQLAKLLIERSCDTYTLLERLIEQQVSGQDIILITAFVSERIMGAKKQLEQAGNAVEIYKIDAEAWEGGDSRDPGVASSPEQSAAGA